MDTLSFSVTMDIPLFTLGLWILLASHWLWRVYGYSWPELWIFLGPDWHLCSMADWVWFKFNFGGWYQQQYIRGGGREGNQFILEVIKRDMQFKLHTKYELQYTTFPYWVQYRQQCTMLYRIIIYILINSISLTVYGTFTFKNLHVLVTNFFFNKHFL
jgi:hypothetical protein